MTTKARRASGLDWWWAALLVVALCALALGFRGFWQLRGVKHWSVSDVFYATIQLFGVTNAGIGARTPPALDAARFLAAFVFYSTFVTTLWRIFQDRAQLTWVRLVYREHVIVCGLGDCGADIVEAARARGDRVVVIEPDARHEDLPRCRGVGAIVLVGATTESWSLQQAAASRAKLALALFGDDDAKVDVAVRLHASSAGRTGGTLRCVLQVQDRRLHHFIRTHPHFTPDTSRVRLETINTLEAAARTMLRETAQQAEGDDPSRDAVLLIVGLGQFGEVLLTRVAKDWAHDHESAGRKLAVKVVALDAPDAVRRICDEHSFIARVCTVEPYALDVRGGTFRRGEFLGDGPGAAGLIAAHVCLSDGALALMAATWLDELLREQNVPIRVCMTGSAGISRLLRGDGGPRSVSLQDHLRTLALAENPQREILAHAIHHEYLWQQKSQGATRASNTSFVPWRELPDDLQQSNRAQADHIPVKLSAIGRRMVIRDHVIDAPAAFTDDEIRQLARMEHDRWVDERLRAGWALGSPKDTLKKISPYLVPWDALDPSIQEYDLNTIRTLPKVLAKADFAIEPMADGG